MFAERFDASMSIAEVSNSLLGRAVNMNGSHIGRLRSGARKLPKKHDYLAPMCCYLAGHITKDYQIIALQKLTGMGNAAFSSTESLALGLEQWLLEQENDTNAATGRLVSGFARLAAIQPTPAVPTVNVVEEAYKPAPYYYYYGNAGKRKAVEQFFLMILTEEKPQTLLLFSDEDMAWLYEDAAFTKRWAELFTRVILKGNRVCIVHTISRNMNELLEAVMKWVPIYMTGAVEPFYYPRLRDGVLQRTMFIAPMTAAIISSSVQQDTNGMLNLFITDKAALEALTTEYERYHALCRPLMRVFTERDADAFQKVLYGLSAAEGAAYLVCALPPLFSLPESLAKELSEQTGEEAFLLNWKKSVSVFRKNIKTQPLNLAILDPQIALLTPERLSPPMAELLAAGGLVYTQTQYLRSYEHLLKLEKKYENLSVMTKDDLTSNTLLYVREDVGVVMAKGDAPMMAFVISEHNMINAFWDYAKHLIHAGKSRMASA